MSHITPHHVKYIQHTWLFLTPWAVACQGPLSTGFSSQDYWSELPFPTPEDFPDSGTEPRSVALQADSLPSELWVSHL